jgi:hypothetical protein
MNNLEFKKLPDGRMAVRRRDGLQVTAADIQLAKQSYSAKAKSPGNDPTAGRILAVLICSHALEADIWLALDNSFNPADNLAVFYADELSALQSKTAEELKAIHEVKLIFPGCRVCRE